MKNIAYHDVERFLLDIKPEPDTDQLDWQADPSFIRHFEAPRIHRIIQVIDGQRPSRECTCLEIGFLHGLTPQAITRFLPQTAVTCIDRHESSIFSSEKVQALNSDKSSRISVIPCDLREIRARTVPLGCFDCIILGEVIEHLGPEFTRELLLAFADHLKPGGFIIVTTPNIMSLWFPLRLLLAMEIHDPPLRNEIMGYGHIHIWSSQGLATTLRDCGYEVCSTYWQNGMYRWDASHITVKMIFKKYFWFQVLLKIFSISYWLNKKRGWTQIMVARRDSERHNKP